MAPNYDLAVNLPLRLNAATLLNARLARTTVDADALAYPDLAGPLDVREAIARWLARASGHAEVDPALIALTIGARHALGLTLLQVAMPRNRVVLVEGRTYHGFRTAARGMGIQCVDVAADEHGARPEALAQAARRHAAQVFYVQPTYQNPTTVTIPLARRQAIVATARELGLILIEGDVYSPLATFSGEALPSLASLAPERVFHAGGIGKILGPGLRVGWLLHPDRESHASTTALIQREQDGLPTLWPRVVARCVDDGSLDAHLQGLAGSMRERGRLARRIVGDDLVVNGACLHAWLPATDPVGVERRLLARGVRVARSSNFVSRPRRPRGVRLSLGAEEDIGRLEEALSIVAEAR